jgi:predicted nucleic acid-binding Zn ribbon protein
MARVCQLAGCGKRVDGIKQFCSRACRAIDYRDRKRAQRAELRAAVAIAIRDLIRKQGGCICPKCDGRCVKPRGRPRKSARQ